jgi:XTP/dITP diphosphohydrolase
VATRNAHKLEEIRDLLGDLPVDFLSLTEAGLERREEEDRIEVHDSFDANAAAKARYFRERSGGLPTAADDSGLCVDALDGGPGVHTRRFAPKEMAERWGRDEANNRHLLETLEGVPEEERTAHYHCSVAVETEEEAFTLRGKVYGRIAEEPRGEGGFGYDPLFVVPELGGTYAELPPEVKQATSHRARAFRKLRSWLERLVEQTAGGGG